MSQELESTLREAIENYLSERLRTIKEDLSRLQEDFNSTIARLEQNSTGGSVAGTSLAESISEHLQRAGAASIDRTDAPAPSAHVVGNLATLKAAAQDITRQTSQVNALGILVSQASAFAERTALFVVKNERAVGWRVRGGPEGTIDDAGLRELVLPLTTDTLLSYVARSHSSWSGEPGSNSEDNLLLEKFGGAPKRIAAVPLVVRGRTVAVLYADSENPDPGSINVDALEMLVLVTASVVDLLSAARIAKQPAEAQMQPAAEAPAPDSVEEFQAPAETMSAVETSIAEAQTEEIRIAPEADTEPLPPTEIEPPSVTPIDPSVFAPHAESVISSAPAFGSEYAAPLGTSRRWGQAEPDLPIEVSDDERRFHTDARRFARLLVSEIKLYNEQKVRDGRSQGDIYERLREDIDRSRQMYEKRIAPPVAARYDYFHQELVKTLADGDSSKLGAAYPGESVAVT